MTLRELFNEIRELNDESLMDKEIMYFEELQNGREIYIPINAIGLSYTKILLTEQCPECSNKIQECINNIYKTEED